MKAKAEVSPHKNPTVETSIDKSGQSLIRKSKQKPKTGDSSPKPIPKNN